MGVCCIVFDIYGMLFEFFMNFLNIEKNKILIIFLQYFMFFFAFHATVVPLIRGHLGARAKVSLHRCSLIRGTSFFQDIMQVQKPIDLSIINKECIVMFHLCAFY